MDLRRNRRTGALACREIVASILAEGLNADYELKCRSHEDEATERWVDTRFPNTIYLLSVGSHTGSPKAVTVRVLGQEQSDESRLLKNH